jgi:PilZ domain-containing protein
MSTIHHAGAPRGDVGLVQEQPLPWSADEVFVSFHGGPAYTSQVTRHPGDLVRIGRGTTKMPVGTGVEIQWTQNRRGSYAEGVVVAAPAGEQPGMYVRIERSVAGVERRLGVRVGLRVPAVLTDAAGRMYRGHSEDLSLGGARIVVTVPGAGRTADDPPFVAGTQVTAELTRGGRTVRLGCLVAGVGAEPGEVRLQFLDLNASALGQLWEFVHGPAPATEDV